MIVSSISFPLGLPSQASLVNIGHGLLTRTSANALASSNRGGALGYFTTPINTLGARSVTVILNVTTAGGNTLRPAIQFSIGGNTYTLAPGPGRTSAGIAYSTFGLVPPATSAVDQVTWPVVLPASISIGYTSSATTPTDSTSVDYVLSF